MSIRRATIDDRDFIKDVYDMPGMIKYLTDDNCPDDMKDQIDMILNTPVIYALISELNDTKTGLWLFFPWNYTTYELHVAILPEYRGQHSINSGIEAGMWMFGNTCCHKIVTTIPKPNYKAKYLAESVGMQQEGINRKSYMKNGILYDMYLYGICKEDVTL
jgi:RimJ/RimL family protein N-acetyltransferase